MNAIKILAETDETVTVSKADLAALIEALEDAEDIAALKAAAAEEARIGKEAYRANCLPIELVERMLAGESPVRIWREHRKMTGRDLASAAEIAPGYLSEIETGKKPGSVDALAKIARALGLSIDDLVAAPEEKEP
jgi:DNA-binding Xre family transcriptional regulator